MKNLIRLLLALDKFLIKQFRFSLATLGRHGGQGKITSLLLTTIGRRSGAPIEVPLFYFRDGEAFYVIASKGGSPDHPLWFSNLEANPQAYITIGKERISVRARIAKGDERSRLWKKALDFYPPYETYQAKALSREIPVVVLERQIAPFVSPRQWKTGGKT